MINQVDNYKGYYISYAPNVTYTKNMNLVGETALVFTDTSKNKRFWILLHDRREDYKKCKTLASAKKLYAKEHEAGNAGFWTDCDPQEVKKILKNK